MGLRFLSKTKLELYKMKKQILGKNVNKPGMSVYHPTVPTSY